MRLKAKTSFPQQKKTEKPHGLFSGCIDKLVDAVFGDKIRKYQLLLERR